MALNEMLRTRRNGTIDLNNSDRAIAALYAYHAMQLGKNKAAKKIKNKS